MRKWFESGIAFFVVAAICLFAGFAGDDAWSFVFVISGVLWLVVGIGIRAKRRDKNKSATPE